MRSYKYAARIFQQVLVIGLVLISSVSEFHGHRSSLRRCRMRNYKRKTSLRPLTQELYEQACYLMKTGVSGRQAAKAIGFSHTALMKKLQIGKGAENLGRFRRTFTSAQEEDLVRHCVELDKRFFGMSLKSLRHLLFAYAKTNGIPSPFSDQTELAGKDCTRDFMKRNGLTMRKLWKTGVGLTMELNRRQVNLYFDNLEEALKEHNFGPESIYSMDETRIQTVPHETQKHVTVACAMSSGGQFVPPFFIFERKQENNPLIKEEPMGCDMAVTEKGYMSTATFLKWMEHFKKFTSPTPEKPILLILDNHISHVSLLADNFAQSNNIHLLALPSHSSHLAQPLYRCFFRPLGEFYDTAADNWMKSKPGQTMSEFEVAELVITAFQRAATVENAVQGFYSAGIHPFDRNKFTDADFLPFEVTDQEPQDDKEEQRFVCIRFKSSELSSQADGNPPESKMQSESIHTTDEESLTQLIGESSSTMSPLHSAEGQSTSGVSASAVVSPKDIIPVPKIKIKGRISGGGLKSVLLTSTSNKRYLEEQEKVEGEKNLVIKKEPGETPVKRIKRESSSDSDSYLDYILP